MRAFLYNVDDGNHSLTQVWTFKAFRHPDVKATALYQTGVFPLWNLPGFIDEQFTFNQVGGTWGIYEQLIADGRFSLFPLGGFGGGYSNEFQYANVNGPVNDIHGPNAQLWDSNIIHGNAHWSNTNGYYIAPSVCGWSCPTSCMSLTGGYHDAPATSYGPTMEFMLASHYQGTPQSFRAYQMCGLASVIWSHNLTWNAWDVRRLMRLVCDRYATGWTKNYGFGYFDLDNVGFSHYDACDSGSIPNWPGPTSFTQNDVASMIQRILDRQIHPVEPPVAIRFHDVGTYPVGVDDFGYSELNFDYGGGFKLDPQRVFISWNNFKSSQWKSTVIVANDSIIYEGTGDRFMWPCNTTGPITFKFYSRAISGELSRDEEFTQFTFNNGRNILPSGRTASRYRPPIIGVK